MRLMNRVSLLQRLLPLGAEEGWGRIRRCQYAERQSADRGANGRHRAKEEREMISARTTAALAAAKAPGKKLGGNRGGPKVDPAQGKAARNRAADGYARQVGSITLTAWQNVPESQGGSGHAVAVLTVRGIRTPRGGQAS